MNCENFALALIIYLIQAIICCGINSYVATKIPSSLMEYLKFTFLPYVLYCVLFNKSLLTED